MMHFIYIALFNTMIQMDAILIPEEKSGYNLNKKLERKKKKLL